MNRSPKVPPNQLRWLMPWKGIGIRCRGCKYLTEARAGFLQCTASWDGFSVVSEEAICRGRGADFSANLPASDETTAAIIDDVESEYPKSCFYDHLCPRCRAPTETTKNGCFICPNCGFRDCEW